MAADTTNALIVRDRIVIVEGLPTKSPETSFEICADNGDIVFVINSIARHAFQGTDLIEIRFPSVSVLIAQLQRISRRIRRPERALSSVPWSRCWPPYRRSQRESSFFIGSLCGFSCGRRRVRCSFSLATHLGISVVWCIERDGEDVFPVPTTFFDSAVEYLLKDQDAEQDETRNPYQPPCFHDLP
jgi:hypothetical protein